MSLIFHYKPLNSEVSDTEYGHKFLFENRHLISAIQFLE